MGLWSRLFSKKKDAPKVEERTLLNIQVGDMITYELEDYEVVGKMTLNDHGFQWFEYQLEVPGEKSLWLSVEMDDELEIAVYKKIKHPVSEPIPKTLTVDEVSYTLDEKGMAEVSGQGRSSQLSGQTVTYYDYSNEAEDQLVAIEVWNGEIEVSQGHTAQDYEFEIIAGSR